MKNSKRFEDNSNIIKKRDRQGYSIIEGFNTKDNLDKCSKLLKSAMENEKKLILVPYAKKKEKVNKTFDTIGDANGISYPNTKMVPGFVLDNQNYLSIIRNTDPDRKYTSPRKDKKKYIYFNNNTKSFNEINLQKKFKELNIQDFNL